MAYTPFTRFVMGGTTDPGTLTQSEIWACSISMMHGTELDGPIPLPMTWLNEIQAGVKTWFQSANAMISTKSQLTYLKANTIGPNGKYLDPTTANTYTYSVPGVGSVAPTTPSICSCCLSWTTPRLRGPGSHGRIFPPNNATSGAATLIINSTVQGNLITSSKALLTVLQNLSGTQTGMPCIASNVDGTIQPITGVRIGNVLDVQRRRKDALRETYVSSSWS